MVDELAPVGGGNTAFDACQELRPLLQNAGHGFFHHSRGVLAFGCGKLPELRFLLGGEMHFHAAQSSRTVAGVKVLRNAASLPGRWFFPEWDKRRMAVCAIRP